MVKCGVFLLKYRRKQNMLSHNSIDAYSIILGIWTETKNDGDTLKIRKKGVNWMIDISLIDPTTLMNILLIAISGTLICLGVHFVPVGGAPAAMAQATGIGTGTVELAAGSGLVGLLTGAYMYANVDNAPMSLVLAAGAMGSMIMISSAMFAASLVYAYGVGVPFASAQTKKDPITGARQDLYMSKGTQGHGLPTVCFVSGVIGAALGGIGGALI
jgi:tetrahydromethanopterin S-methyltransferase subunit D